MAVQVCYDMKDDNTLLREKGALTKLASHLEIKRALIITRDSESEMEEEGLKIEVQPVWKWLLSSSGNSHV